MFLILAVLAIAMIIISRVVYNKRKEARIETRNEDFISDLSVFFGIGGSIVLAVCIGISILLTINICTEFATDEKIALFETENAKIESDIKETVEQYMKHEENIYSNALSSDNYINVVAAIPDLNSSELVKKQLDIYKSNTEQILSLKEYKVKLKQQKWLLYLGR